VPHAQQRIASSHHQQSLPILKILEYKPNLFVMQDPIDQTTTCPWITSQSQKAQPQNYEPN
jgi:hypothetical protein